MVTRLSNIANIIMGQSPKSEFYNSIQNGLPFLQGRTTFGDKYPSFDTYTTQYNKTALKGDILLTVRAPVGDLNIAQTTIAIGRGIAAIRPINCSTEYLYYLLSASKNVFLMASSGTIYEAIDIKSLSNVELSIHDKATQQHIVDTI